MSAAESPATQAVEASPFEILQARVFPSSRVESAGLLLLAVAGPILLFGLGLAARVPGPVLLTMLLVPTPALEALVALRYRALWPAQEVLSWISWEAMEDWRKSVGGRYPASRRQVEEWLDQHREGSAPAAARAGILLLAGRTSEARAAIASLPEETAPQRYRRADLEFVTDALEGAPLDSSVADAAMRSDPEVSPSSAAAHLAYRASLQAVAGGGDGLASLIEARPLMGALPPALVRRLWLDRMRFAVSSAVGAVWLWVCLIVALGTAGGVVWF